ncbi:subtilisin family serine protease [Bradyrhizobium sp. USDA 4501]
MMLKCGCPEGHTIKGYVEFVFPDGSSFGSEIEDGMVEVPVLSNTYPRMAVVKPMDGHWNTIVMRPSSATSCRCEAITYVGGKPWWKSIVGASRENGGAGVRIGVIDLGFQPWPSLAHLKFMNAEGQALDFDYVPPTSHGTHVCQVLCGRGRGETDSGIAPDAEVLFVDVSDKDYVDRIDSELIPAAIHLLADMQVDLINISGGSYVPDGRENEFDRVLFSAVNYARDQGCLVVAATGNEASRRPAIPARLPNVIGVGGMGAAEVAPVGSLMHGVQTKAKKANGAWGKLDDLEVFHYLHSSYGTGLDVIAPAVGITICYSRRYIYDREGTSFSSPIVVGILACALSVDPAYKLLAGAQRADFAAKKLTSMCMNLGLDQKRQGKGLPVLCAAC